MKIAIICDSLDIVSWAWITSYARWLVSGLAWAEEGDLSLVYLHTSFSEDLDVNSQLILPVPKNRFLFYLYSPFRKFILIPLRLRKHGIDVVHDLSPIGPHLFDFFRPYRVVLTIYDVTPLLHRRYHSFLNFLWFLLFVPFSLHLADKIIAISESTRADVHRLFNVKFDRISVVPLASDPPFKISDEAKRMNLSKLGLCQDAYILCVWTLEPRKNLSWLISAFSMLCAENSPIWLKLVLAWGNWWKLEKALSSMSNLPDDVRNRIAITGFVSSDVLDSLYGGCLFFAYPSFYEWFWLPVLEAMMRGKAVLTSDISSIPEVAWDSALYVNPHNIQDIRNWLRTLLSNPDLRLRLESKWLERSKCFSWKMTAKRTLDIYAGMCAKA